MELAQSQLQQRTLVLANPQGRRRVRTSGLVEPVQDARNIVVSCCVSVLLLCGFAALWPERLGWYLLPVLLCGCLSGIDLVAYTRGRLDSFDPSGILGVYGYYFFFLAPLLTIVLDYHTKYLVPPLNWTEWIGWLSAINALGLFFYLGSRRAIPVTPPRRVWLVRKSSFFTVMSIALPVTFACQILVFVQFGGVLGFMETFSKQAEEFSGMGYLFMVAEAFPIFLAIAVLVWKRKALQRSSWLSLTLLVLGFLVLKLLFGGLRGSRSLTVWGLFWMVGAIHYWIRPIPKKALLVGFLFTVTFTYFYGFYKDVGLDALDLIRDPSKISTLEENSGRTLTAALLGDMARTDIQTILLSRVSNASDFEYAHGATYLEAFSFIIPKAVWADRPEGKVRAGTEALLGHGVYDRTYSRASYVYGLVGEAMLNFPPIFASLAFIPLAYAITKMRSLLLADRDDMRRLLLPMLGYAALLLLTGDLDNFLFAAISIALAPVLIVRASCRSVAALKD